MGRIGYNTGEIANLGNTINKTAEDIAKMMCDEIDSQVLTPMSHAWAAQEAKDYFDGFAQDFAAAASDFTTVFEVFAKNIESAGKNWAENTKNEAPTVGAISTVTFKLNTDVIQIKDGNGDIYIDDAEAQRVAGTLPSVRDKIVQLAKASLEQLDAATSFLGEGQAEAINECFTRLSEFVDRFINFLNEGDSSISTNVNKAVEKYKEVASSTGTAFASGN